MANSKLTQAKNTKNDEFYTQLADIEKELQAYLEYNPDVFKGKTILCPCDDPYESNFFKYFALRFNDLGLKKLIATCYAGSPIASTQLTLFDNEPEENKTTRVPHKIEITEVKDYNEDSATDLRDVQWIMANIKGVLTRLDGDGDFRSNEVTALRDEADVIVTNPPFSLFREFMAWIVESNKQFLVIGNITSVTYKEIFPLIKDNKLWLGNNCTRWFTMPNGNVFEAARTYWYTNLDHGRRHQPIPLMNTADNLKFSKHKELKGKEIYDKYDNYNAIEVPFTDAIPSDYEEIMGVPSTFIEKYCPEQFEIVGMCENLDLYNLKTKVYTTEECQQAYFAKFRKNGTYDLNASAVLLKNGFFEKMYQRILIRHRKGK